MFVVYLSLYVSMNEVMIIYSSFFCDFSRHLHLGIICNVSEPSDESFCFESAYRAADGAVSGQAGL